MKATKTSLLNLALAAFVLLGVAVNCVPTVEIEGTPCPCPEETFCCESLSTCLPPGEFCPESYPPSSGQACTHDADCPSNELCHAWTLEGEVLAGPQTCRHECSNRNLPCADGEACEPVPHDGLPLSDVNFAWACVPEEPPPGCEGHSCRACDSIGGTSCDEDQLAVLACFLAVHPSCGLSCQKIELEACDEPGSQCEVIEGGARCSISNYDGDVCSIYPCGDCDLEPGTFACADDSVMACSRIAVMPEMCPDGSCSCSEICLYSEFEACTGTCSEENGAHCIP